MEIMFLITLLAFVIAIVLLIFVHELGHYTFAKLTKCQVDEFSVGFRPALWQKKYGETNYVLGVIPIGGYVKIWGENGSAEIAGDTHNPRAFCNRPRWAQALVLSGGIIYNIVFAWLLFSLLIVLGLSVNASQVPSYTLQDQTVTVTSVLADYPADRLGILPGDSIIGFDSARSAQDYIQQHAGLETTISLTRPSTDSTYTVDFTTQQYQNNPVFGASLEDRGTLQLPIGPAAIAGAYLTFGYCVLVFDFLLDFFASMVSGTADYSAVAGPVGIAAFAGDSLAHGATSFIFFLAILSINLAIFNLLPIPALDGGRLVVVAIESLWRKSMSPQWFTYINIGGFLFLIGLVAVVTIFDISKLI